MLHAVLLDLVTAVYKFYFGFVVKRTPNKRRPI